MKIAISGPSGLIGSHLVTALAARGHDMLPMVRHSPAAPTEIGWDPATGLTTPERMEGVDALIHLAGVNLASGRWTAARKAAFRESRVDATARLCESLLKLDHSPPRVLCASAIGYYGWDGDQEADEATGPGGGFLADLTRDWEAASAPLDGAGVARTCFRLGAVLSREGGALAKMLPVFRLGLGGPLGHGRQPFSWIHIADVEGIVAHLLERPDLTGPVNATAPEPVTNREFVRALGRALRRPAVLPAPAFALRLLLGEMADEMLLHGARVLPRRLLDHGYTFRFPALDEALADLLNHG